MIQAFGLTSDSRKDLPSAVDDVSFEVHPGRVTALLGAAGAGKTTTLRLMLELQQGRGITYFKGRPLHRIPRPANEVGALLGDVPGHPARTVRGHLRMLCAAAGLPARRADEVLEAVGLVSLREERLGTLSRGTDRRLGLACVLLSEPHTLVLDDPADGLSAREGRWLHGVLRAHATQGGTVLFATADPKEAARAADRVLTLERGVLVADQDVTDFARNRLRPRVAVRTPHAARLAALLAKESRTDRRSVEVVHEDGNRLSVYGSTCADVGETAFRHGILIHQLADEVGDMGPGAGAAPRPVAALAGRRAPGTAASVAVDRRQAPVGVSSAGSLEPAVVRRPADFRTSDGAARPGRTLPDRQPAATGSGLPGAVAAAPAPAARAADPTTGTPEAAQDAPALDGGVITARAEDASAPASVQGEAVSDSFEDASATDWPEGAADVAESVSADPVSIRAVSVARRPEGTSVAAHADSGACAAVRDGGRPAPGADGRPGPAHAEPRSLAADAENPPSGTGTRPGAPSAPRPDGRSMSTGPGDDLMSERRPDSGLRPVFRTDEPAPGPVVRHSLRPEAEQPEPSRGPAGQAGGSRPAAGQPTPPHTAASHPSIPTPRPAEAAPLDASSPLPPPISVRLAPGPLRPLRYELRRASGISTGFVTSAAVLVVSALTALIMGAAGHSPQPRLLAAWPWQLPLPPAALGAGLLGALAFGDEFRHPALAADRGTVPRRFGLLAAKLVVAAATALTLAFLTVGCDAEVLYLVYGRELTQVPGDWLSLGAGWFGLVVGCAWTGLLAAGLFRSTTAGLAAVVAVPVVVAPLARLSMGGAAWDADGLPARLRRSFLLQWPFGGDRYLAAAARVIAQPVGGALTLSLVALASGYLLTVLRSRAR
ncbi:ATP-binding cassette domain-containing protein [Streptomyces sp. NPDC018610]|uniref:ATP-binding cassette domain-containing protein n=1 Tax=Streptomyces sp. NPDC018610 TaxID=3365049 RepID=UPI0037968703